MNAQQLSDIIAKQVSAALAAALKPQASAQPVTAAPVDRMAKARAAKAAKAGKVAPAAPAKPAKAASEARPAANPDAARVWRRGEDHTSEKGRTYAVFFCSGVDGESAEWASKIPFDLFSGIIEGTVKSL